MCINSTVLTQRIVMFLDNAESALESTGILTDWKTITNGNFYNLLLPTPWVAYPLAVPMDSAELIALRLLSTGVDVHHL